MSVCMFLNWHSNGQSLLKMDKILTIIQKNVEFFWYLSNKETVYEKDNRKMLVQLVQSRSSN